MASIKEVAARAGVSISTVSKYINRSSSLTADYRRRVEAAVRDMNYRPSPVARSLRTRKTNVIALIVPDITNPFYTGIYANVRAAAKAKGFETILYSTEDDIEEVNALLARMSSYQADGIILAYCDEDESITQLDEIKTDIPITLFSWDINTTKFSAVINDLGETFFRVTKHVIELGHRQVAYVNGPAFSRISKEKMGGFVRAMQKYGLTVDESLIYAGNKYSYHIGFQAAAHFMNNRVPPTAIVCANDILAIGCIKYLTYTGYQVPDNVAVTGCDGTEISYVFDPSVTTMRLPYDDMSVEAVRILVNKIEHPNAKNVQAVFDTQLYVRKSTKKDAAVILDL